MRFVDVLGASAAGRLRRERAQRFVVDELTVDQWRYGRSPAAFIGDLKALQADGWSPDRVFVECFASIWWRGAREVVRAIRRVFPRARVAVVGAYATEMAGHVRRKCGAVPVTTAPPALLRAPIDWSMWSAPPVLGYLSTAGGARSSENVLDEIESGVRHGVRQFAFAEHGVFGRQAALARAVLEGVLARGLKVRFIVTGAASPSDLLRERDLIPLLRRAGCAHIFFADDRDIPLGVDGDRRLVDAYRQVSELCHRAGFRARSDMLNGGMSLGRPEEELSSRAALLTRIAAAIGPVVVWPYQPGPDECDAHGVPRRLELHSGKLFPLRTANGVTYLDYLKVLGLAAVLSAKYREHTFDFGGPGLIASLFRDSLARGAWDPDPSIKGGLRLPVRPPRCPA